MAGDFGLSDEDHLAFCSVGAVCLHEESELSQPPGNAQMVAASSRFGLVFFADTRGAPDTVPVRATHHCLVWHVLQP